MGEWESNESEHDERRIRRLADAIRHFRDLRVYQEAFDLSMELFMLSKNWPHEERYALTSQIRRSSRSVCANIAEAWRKRRYTAHFVSKLSDADTEAGETQAWLDFSLKCEYMVKNDYSRLNARYESVIGGLVRMMAEPEKWCGPANMVREESEDYHVNPELEEMG